MPQLQGDETVKKALHSRAEKMQGKKVAQVGGSDATAVGYRQTWAIAHHMLLVRLTFYFVFGSRWDRVLPS